MKKVVIYGIGKMAEFIHYSFLNDSSYDVVAFCVDEKYLSSEMPDLFGCPVLSFDETLKRFPPDECLIHIAIGRNSAREIIFQQVKAAGYSCASYTCSKANVWPDLVVGENVFIDQASVIHPFVNIGNNCILIGARVGHHCTIEDHVLLSGTSLAGNVTIRRNSFLGLNSSIKEGVVVGSHNTVSAGVFITKHTTDHVLTYLSRSAVSSVKNSRLVVFPENTRE